MVEGEPQGRGRESEAMKVGDGRLYPRGRLPPAFSPRANPDCVRLIGPPALSPKANPGFGQLLGLRSLPASRKPSRRS
jgi:hypothetical protein